MRRADASDRGWEQRPCALCDGPTVAAARHTNPICAECGARTTDAAGRPVRFTCVDISGDAEGGAPDPNAYPPAPGVLRLALLTRDR